MATIPHLAPLVPSRTTEPLTAARHLAYRADIDGLRAVAVLAVVGFHAFPAWVPGGFIGVDVFFVISGFLISTILLESLARGRFSFAEFLGRRIRRLFPALLVVLSALWVFGWFGLLVDEYRQLGKHIAGGAGYVANLVLWSESGYFDNGAHSKPLLHLWSLGIEEQFYIVWPVLLWLAWTRGLNPMTLAVVVGLVSFVLNVRTLHTDSVAAFYSPLTRFWELLAGAVLASVAIGRRSASVGDADAPALREASSLVGATLLLAGLLVIDKTRAFPGWWATLPVAGATLIIAAGPGVWLNRVVLSSRPLVWFGLISFPLYLWHWPLLSLATIVQSETPSRTLRVAAVAASILLAWLTYRFVERPLRSTRRPAATATVLAVLMGAAGCVGFATYRYDGLAFRESVRTAQRVSAEFVGPTWQYARNELCTTRYPFPEANDYRWWFCMQARDEPPTVLVLGNSFANDLYAGLATNPRLAHHNPLSIGTCDPGWVDATTLSATVDASPCSGFRALHQQRLVDRIVEQSRSVRFALLGGLPHYPDDAYIAALTKRIDFLERAGITVVVFAPYIRIDYDIRACFARPLRQAARDCEVPLSERDRVTAGFAPLVKRISTTNPKVAFFDQNALFCDASTCSMVKDGMPLLRDEFHHLSEYGSVRMVALFEDWARTNLPDVLRPAP
jgi:peptidoglycan/LPS O-acetylase OafA/YrhL